MHRPQTRLKSLFSLTGKDSDFVAFVFKCFFERTSTLVGIARQVWPSFRLVVMATQCCRNVHRILAPVGTLCGKQNKAAESSSLPRIFNNHSGEVSRYVNRMSTFAGEPQCIEVSLLYCIGHRQSNHVGIWHMKKAFFWWCFMWLCCGREHLGCSSCTRLPSDTAVVITPVIERFAQSLLLKQCFGSGSA